MCANPDTVVYARKLVASLERKIVMEKPLGIDRSKRVLASRLIRILFDFNSLKCT